MPLAAAAVAGPYSATFAAGALGVVQDGFRIRHDILEQEITGDAYGRSIIESVCLGANVVISAVCLEANAAGANSAAENFGAAIGLMPLAGTLATDAAIGAFVMTALSGRTASTAPATLTAPNAYQTRDLDLTFASRLREFPLQLRCLPDTLPTAAVVGFFDVT